VDDNHPGGGGLEIEPNLIGWAGSFMLGRQVKPVPDREVGEANPVDTSLPQGSPTVLALFITYLSGIFDEVERVAPGIRGLSFCGRHRMVGRRCGEGDEAVTANCRKVMTAGIQSIAMFGLELGWKGDLTWGTIGQANELRVLAN